MLPACKMHSDTVTTSETHSTQLPCQVLGNGFTSKEVARVTGPSCLVQVKDPPSLWWSMGIWGVAGEAHGNLNSAFDLPKSQKDLSHLLFTLLFAKFSKCKVTPILILTSPSGCQGANSLLHWQLSNLGAGNGVKLPDYLPGCDL